MPSTVIRRFQYRPAEKILEVQFVSGRRYLYHDVPQAVYDQMRRSLSKGEFFNAHVRDHFSFERIGDLRGSA